VLESSDVVVRKAALQPLLGTVVTAARAVTLGRALRDIADDAARSAERDAIREALRASRGNKCRR
jgi:hypothetical protein